MKYVKPEVASEQAGLRLALTAHMPAPYSMSARAVFDHHRVPYTAVEQVGAGENEALLSWTGHRNAPVAVYNSEVARVGWLEILNLAERLGSGASLVPDDIDLRMQMMGMTSELIGENGWVWNMRLLMLGGGGAERAEKEAARNPMYKDYGYSEDAKAIALDKACQVLDRFAIFAQASKGEYLCGDRLSAIDIYWVFFSNLLKTLSHEDCPMPAGLRKSYEMSGGLLGEIDPILIAQRDFIIKNHFTLPMVF
ncbi:MAG: hypothetical protein P8L31_11925 [Pseudomonadales bacterium]|jgi:hypothetical protein|nr:hypothetical protein [Pseudomonadales bacterium]